MLNDSKPESASSKDNYQKLRAEYEAVKKKEDSKRVSRGAVFERIKNLDTQIKVQLNKVQQEKAKLAYRTEAEYDAEVNRLEKQVGLIKLVEERENAKRVDFLRHQKKSLNLVRENEQRLDELKAKKTQEKSLLDDAEARQFRAEMDNVQERIRAAQQAQSDSYDKLNKIRAELQEAKNSQNAQYAHVRKIKDDHYNGKREYQAYEREASKQREERRRVEREKLFQEKQQEVLQQRLEEAKIPAYYEEIRAAESLIRLVNPGAVPEEVTTKTNELAAQPQRTVDAAGMKGKPLAKKPEDEAYFIGGGSKKAKRDKKSKASDAPVSEPAKVLGRFLTQRPLEQLSLLEIAPPSSEHDLSRVLEQLLAKHRFLLDDRPRKTEEVS